MAVSEAAGVGCTCAAGSAAVGSAAVAAVAASVAAVVVAVGVGPAVRTGRGIMPTSACLSPCMVYVCTLQAKRCIL